MADPTLSNGSAPAEVKHEMRHLLHPELHRHHKGAPAGVRIANAATGLMGSWRFIIIQTIAVLIWITLNLIAVVNHWDPYPFILLNLLFSVQAAYAAPLILMAGNVAAARDRDLWEHDYKINQDAYAKIEKIELRTQELVQGLKDLVEARSPEPAVRSRRSGVAVSR